jgi:hypothetical protein
VTDPLESLLELPGVVDGVAGSRAAVDAMLTHRALRRRSPDVSAESALRGAWASAVLSGSASSLTDVRSGAAADDPIVQGALRAQAEIGPATETWSHAPRQVLARLHAVAAASLVDDPDLLGRPSEVAGVAERLDTLASVLADTTAPAVVVAGVVHGEILALDAFPPVSGIVARTAERLTLVERGLDPNSLVTVEAGHRELLEEYEAALLAYRDGTRDGLAQWLGHCADAVVIGAQETSAICEAIVRG